MNSNLTKNNDGISLRNSAFITGIGLIIMAILAPVANFAILQKLIVSGNAAKTTSNIIASEGLFRLCIGFFFIVAILDIIGGYQNIRAVNKVVVDGSQAFNPFKVNPVFLHSIIRILLQRQNVEMIKE